VDDDLRQRLEAAGFSDDEVRALGATVDETAAVVPGDAWSVSRFAVPALLDCTTATPTLQDLVAALSRLLQAMVEQDLSPTRTLQYGLPALGRVGRADVAAGVLAASERLVDEGIDPGEVLRLVVPTLAEVFAAEGFAAVLDVTVTFVAGVHAVGVAVSLPLATAVEALVTASTGDAARFVPWLERLYGLVEVMGAAGSEVYPLMEYGIPAAARALSPIDDRLGEMLDLAFAMASRGLVPTALLVEGSSLAAMAPEPAWHRMERTVVELTGGAADPTWVVVGGYGALFAAHRVWDDECEQAADDLDRAARAMAANGLGSRIANAMRYGPPTLAEALRQGDTGAIDGAALRRGLALQADLAAAGLDPCLTVEHGLPAAAALRERAPWILDELFPVCERFVAAGAAPEGLLRWCLRPLLDGAAGDRAAFAQACRAVADLTTELQRAGVAIHDVLYYDVPALATVQDMPSDEFTTFLGRFSSFLAAVQTRALDGADVMQRGLPAVARAAEGRRWLLTAALTTAEQLAADGVDPAPCMTFAVPAAARAAGYDEQTVSALLAVLADFARDVRDDGLAARPLFQTVVPALCSWAFGGDDGNAPVDRFAAMLTTLRTAARPLAGRPDGVDYLARALPFLVERWGDDDGTTTAMATHLAGLVAACTDAELSRLACLGSLQTAAAELAADDPATTRETLTRLVDVFLRHPDLPGGLAASALPAVGRICRSRPHDGLTTLAAVADRARSLPSSMSADDFLATACPLAEATAALDGSGVAFVGALTELGDGFADEAVAAEARRNLQALDRLLPWVRRRPADLAGVVVPVVRTHGPGAPAMLAVLELLAPSVTGDAAAALLRHVITQRGVRAFSLLHDFIGEALRTGCIDSLDDEAGLVRSFLDDLPFHEPSLYERYRAVMTDGTRGAAERRSAVSAMARELDEMAAAVRRGEPTANHAASELWPLVLYHVFPPSLTMGRDAYAWLYREFADHPEHVTTLGLPAAVRQVTRSFAAGGYRVREGCVIDRRPWEVMVGVVEADEGATGSEDDDEARETTGRAAGAALVTTWAEGRLGRPAERARALGFLYRRYRAGGAGLPREATTVEALLKYREFLADGLLELVQEACAAWRAEDPDRYGALCRQRLTPRVKAGPGLVKALWGTVSAHMRGTLGRDEAAERLERQLKHFAIDGAAALDLLADARNADEVATRLGRLERGAVPYHEGKECQRIHAVLAGPDLAAMTCELFGSPATGPGKLEYRVDDGGPGLNVTFELTKRRAHGAVGFSEGVCTARDRQLWDDPRFLQIVFWSDEGTAVGGAHLLLVDEDGGTWAALPGINPSLALLGRVRLDEFVQALFDFVRGLTRAAGWQGIWIPTTSWIHSNRAAVSRYLFGLDLPERSTAGHRFSFSPSYRIDRVWTVPLRTAATFDDERKNRGLLAKTAPVRE